MSDTSSEQQIAVSAKWWADQLRSKVQPSRQTERPGQPDVLGAFLSIYGGAKAPDIDESRILAFEQALIPLLTQWTVDEPHKGVGCDYDPDDLLLEAAEIAGIEDIGSYLPIKTKMWLEDGKVRVKVGYGSPIETIYPTDDRAD